VVLQKSVWTVLKNVDEITCKQLIIN